MTPSEAREVFNSQLDRIERILRFTCRRNGLSADESEEFRSDVHFRLVADDYRLLRDVDHPSTLGSFLVVVVQRLLLDYRTRKWGRWRPSVAAVEAGDVAVRLEILVVRDGVDFPEACEILRRNHGVTEDRDELYALLQTFPIRRGLASQQRVDLDDQRPPQNPDDPEEHLANSARERTELVLADCLRQQLNLLPPEDRLLVHMVYVDRKPVSVIARALGLKQRPLYRRLERLQLFMRRALEAVGITREQTRDLLESRRGLQFLDLGEIVGGGPSSPEPETEQQSPGSTPR